MKFNEIGTHQQVSGFAGDAVIVKIVGCMGKIVICGRVFCNAIFENVGQRGRLHACR